MTSRRDFSTLGIVWKAGQVRKLFSRSFLPLFRPALRRINLPGGKPTKENKYETSKFNSHSDGGCLHWAFAKSAGSQPATPRGLSQLHHCCGDLALQALTLGLGNTAIGTFSLFSVTTGSFNTAVGAGALDLNTADSNTATGAAALLLNTTGTENTANGTAALEFNDIGFQNTATGAFALFSNTAGVANTASGASALFSNTGGQSNTATGVEALSSNTTANFNTAVGNSALSSNTTGGSNTAIGSTALANSTTGSGNIGLGNNAGANVITATDVTCIGNVGKDVNNSCFISRIRGVQTQNANAIPVLIDSDGQLGTLSSSRRFKKEIKAMDKASEAILALEPVRFHYNSDKSNTPQFGLIAEEVAAGES